MTDPGTIDPLVTAKRALRASLRARRDGFGRHDVPEYPPFLARLSPGLTVASYIAVGSEADPAPLAHAAAAAGCRLALPHVVRLGTPMRFLRWDIGTPLVVGPYGLQQPAADAAECAPDIILAPLVGFDRAGNRIGQGGGFYDRAFAAHRRAWRVGVALSVQQVDRLIPDAWDMPLHAIATEQDWIEP